MEAAPLGARAPKAEPLISQPSPSPQAIRGIRASAHDSSPRELSLAGFTGWPSGVFRPPAYRHFRARPRVYLAANLNPGCSQP